MKRLLVRLGLLISRYKIVGSTDEPRGIFVGYPHTSAWDFFAGVAVMWHLGLSMKILVKKEAFKGPMGWLVRRLGGIPMDRQNPGNAVADLAAMARESSGRFAIVLAAEGTRGETKYWKSGFYRIAQQSGLPIILSFIDGPTRTIGVGPVFHPSGDIKADMEMVRAFYADKHGIKPKELVPPRLREEDAA
ncbi:1-acyl-sn-glycerol-3-phosphate acyltransferase [Smaragdicoccus niigatensis]|uniref:1-acyl-sn-glycerol-3-phosphate acyltransferase n=1 Tax=Smaragdicoccus niigatensis TaxID=359359 RepID=UPI00035D53B4|nr:1-acyl-sn-glycerol-3-phosphate acyltransferase [Smaragdicoccus niigatensis]